MKRLAALSVLAATLAAGCGPTVTVKHEVEPIYVTVDVNVRVQNELNDFFQDVEQSAEQGGN
jgi:hypothetical protein